MIEDHGTAGASARREYERRCAGRERRLRERYGSTLGGLAARVTDEPVTTKNWLRGAEGEVRAAALLGRQLAGKGVVLLHDRRMPRSKANVDHLAIGPGGVTVIDPKAYKGRVRVERRGGLFSQRRELLLVGGRDRTKLVDGLERQIAAVRAALGDAVDVRGVLCWMNAGELPLLGHLEMRGIAIDGPKRAARVAARPGDLAPEAVDALAHAVSIAFPPA